MERKVIFTTGEIADLIHIHQTTVIDWIDKGLLPSYKTPGGHRRISKEALITFLNKHNMPIPHVLTAAHAVPSIDEAHRHLHEGYQMGPLAKQPAAKKR